MAKYDEITTTVKLCSVHRDNCWVFTCSACGDCGGHYATETAKMVANAHAQLPHAVRVDGGVKMIRSVGV